MNNTNSHPTGETSQSEKCRLKEQGFINQHRKTIFRILAAALVADFLFIPDFFIIPEYAILSLQLLGISLIFFGIIGRVFSTISIGGLKNREIVSSECYSICRNPLYFSSFLMAIGLGLLSVRLDFFIGLIIVYLLIFYPMMRNEARFLRERFPGYAEYETKVPLFLPNLRLWRARNQIQIDFNLVKRTLLDALIMLPVGIFVCMISVFRHSL